MSIASEPCGLFRKKDGTQWNIFVEASGIQARPRLVKTLKRNGANVCSDPAKSEVIVVNIQSREGRHFIRDWGADTNKVVLEHGWVTACILAVRVLGPEDNWGGHLAIDDGLSIAENEEEYGERAQVDALPTPRITPVQSYPIYGQQTFASHPVLSQPLSPSLQPPIAYMSTTSPPPSHAHAYQTLGSSNNSSRPTPFGAHVAYQLSHSQLLPNLHGVLTFPENTQQMSSQYSSSQFPVLSYPLNFQGMLTSPEIVPQLSPGHSSSQSSFSPHISNFQGMSTVSENATQVSSRRSSSESSFPPRLSNSQRMSAVLGNTPQAYSGHPSTELSSSPHISNFQGMSMENTPQIASSPVSYSQSSLQPYLSTVQANPSSQRPHSQLSMPPHHMNSQVAPAYPENSPSLSQRSYSNPQLPPNLLPVPKVPFPRKIPLPSKRSYSQLSSAAYLSASQRVPVSSSKTPPPSQLSLPKTPPSSSQSSYSPSRAASPSHTSQKTPTTLPKVEVSLSLPPHLATPSSLDPKTPIPSGPSTLFKREDGERSLFYVQLDFGVRRPALLNNIKKHGGKVTPSMQEADYIVLYGRSTSFTQTLTLSLASEKTPISAAFIDDCILHQKLLDTQPYEFDLPSRHKNKKLSQIGVRSSLPPRKHVSQQPYSASQESARDGGLVAWETVYLQ